MLAVNQIIRKAEMFKNAQQARDIKNRPPPVFNELIQDKNKRELIFNCFWHHLILTVRLFRDSEGVFFDFDRKRQEDKARVALSYKIKNGMVYLLSGTSQEWVRSEIFFILQVDWSDINNNCNFLDRTTFFRIPEKRVPITERDFEIRQEEASLKWKKNSATGKLYAEELYDKLNVNEKYLLRDNN